MTEIGCARERSAAVQREVLAEIRSFYGCTVTLLRRISDITLPRRVRRRGHRPVAAVVLTRIEPQECR